MLCCARACVCDKKWYKCLHRTQVACLCDHHRRRPSTISGARVRACVCECVLCIALSCNWIVHMHTKTASTRVSLSHSLACGVFVPSPTLFGHVLRTTARISRWRTASANHFRVSISRRLLRPLLQLSRISPDFEIRFEYCSRLIGCASSAAPRVKAFGSMRVWTLRNGL